MITLMAAPTDRPPRHAHYQPRGTWSEQRVIAAISQWAQLARPLRAYQFSPALGRAAGLLGPQASLWELEWPRWPTLDTIARLLGSWKDALHAAGLAAPVPERLPLTERITTARALAATGTSPAEIAEILEVHRDTVYEYLHGGDCPVCGRPKARSRSRTCVVCAPKKHVWPTFSDTQLLDALRAWTDRHGTEPTTYDWQAADRGGHPDWEADYPAWPPVVIVVRRFGSWQNALTAAGLGRHWRRWDDEELSAALRDWTARTGHPPTKRDFDHADRARWPATSVIVRRFGTWNAALGAAGVSPARRAWDLAQIEDALRDLARMLGRPPTARDLGRRHGDYPSHSAVTRSHGGLPSARRAAGLC